MSVHDDRLPGSRRLRVLQEIEDQRRQAKLRAESAANAQAFAAQIIGQAYAVSGTSSSAQVAEESSAPCDVGP